MSPGFTYCTTKLLMRIKHFRMHHTGPGRWTLFDRLRQPQVGGQPDWVHVPGRTWRRHSMLLMSLHDMHCDLDHE